ncbi:hypothetical protein I79_011758 [Cricetulus griseus]|uniref:Uncharacterized protein n=1 Tax=Cricetulus griseus TaxID=10029 RepID=G3HM14_CRIGR|nr:hypothetical protein I79_011758 [Cricetulus griseus]
MTKSKLCLGAHTWLAKAERLPQIEATLGYSLRPCLKKQKQNKKKKRKEIEKFH